MTRNAQINKINPIMTQYWDCENGWISLTETIEFILESLRRISKVEILLDTGDKNPNYRRIVMGIFCDEYFTIMAGK